MVVDDVTVPTQSVVLITRLARAIRHRFNEGLAPRGLRQRHLVALTYLRDHGATPQQDLAGALRIDPSNLVGLLNELEDRELVARRHAPGDRRRHIVEITSGGERTLAKDVNRLLDSIEEDVLGALSAEERERLHCLLTRAVGGAPAGTGCPDDAFRC